MPAKHMPEMPVPTTSPARTRLLVIGYGNTLRGDDSLGPRLVGILEAMNLPGLTTLECGLLTPEVADPVSNSDVVIFADAAVDAPREVQFRELEPAETSQIMAHAANPRTILALARDVFGHAPTGWWLTIPAESLGFTEEITASAQAGLDQAVQLILEFHQKQLTGSPGQAG